MRRSTAVLLAAGAVMVTTSMTAPQASASTAALSDCAANSVCGWSGARYTGLMTTFTPAASCKNALINSIANTYRNPGLLVVARVYSGAGCTGTTIAVVKAGEAVPVLPSAGRSVSVVI